MDRRGQPEPDAETALVKTSESDYSSGPFSVGSSRPRSFRIPWSQRLLLVCCGVATLLLLSVAASLQPNPRGYGTHQQLGLTPCTFQLLFGVRCPSCGMTTAWANVVRGRLPQAVRSNAAGTVLALLALLAAPWSLCSGLRGKWVGVRPDDYVILLICLSICVLTLGEWAVRMVLLLGR